VEEGEGGQKPKKEMSKGGRKGSQAGIPAEEKLNMKV